uniref:Uncharacterized protein n=1 Tax=Cereibacter sphaeroides (strain ATCC 17025 / ATH 2.4.3) TaxID=349102 RepID=A4WVN9_CERS5
MAVDGPVIDIDLIVIGHIHQLVPALDEARPLGERLKQQELGHRERNVDALPADGMAQRIHAQVAALQDAVLFLNVRLATGERILPTQERADPLDQEALREGLLDIVVGPHAQAEHLVDLVILRGEEDHRHRRLLPKALEEVHPIHARHLDVEHRHVRHPLVEGIERRLTVIVGLDLEPFGLERHGNRSQDIAVVIDEGDPGHILNSNCL